MSEKKSIVLEIRPEGVNMIDMETLHKKVSEVFSESEADALVNAAKLPSREMTLIAAIKSDIAGKDLMGYRKFRDILRKEGFDV